MDLEHTGIVQAKEPITAEAAEAAEAAADTEAPEEPVMDRALPIRQSLLVNAAEAEAEAEVTVGEV